MKGEHFKLGLFVVASTGLLVLMLLLLGVFARFKPSVRFETYFFENIQGLRPGAAVRYRGLQLGTVRRVGFATADYDEAQLDSSGVFGQAILVEMDIEPASLAQADVDRAQIAASVERGLRTRLTASGLGGPTSIEINFLDPVRFPAPTLPWTPDDIFIPSAPSTIKSLLTSLETILNDVDETQLVSKLADLAGIGSDLSALVSGLEDSSLLDSLNASLEALRLASNDARALLTDERIGDLLDDTSVTLADVRAVIADGRDEIGPLIENLLAMADALEGAAGSLDGLVTSVETTDLIPQLASLADALGPAGRDLSDLAGRLDRLIASNDAGIADTIRSLRRVALQLESLLEQAEADPSRFIFGQPPPRRTPGGAP